MRSDVVPYLALAVSLVALAVAAWCALTARRPDGVDETATRAMATSRREARAALRRNLRWAAALAVVLAVVVHALVQADRPWPTVALLTGAILAALAGLLGASFEVGAGGRDRPGRWGGASQGFTATGLALLGLSVWYQVGVEGLELVEPLMVLSAFVLGASSVALFTRLAGHASRVVDLLESSGGAIVAAIVLGSFAFDVGPLVAAGVDIDLEARATVFPLAVVGIGVLASMGSMIAMRMTGDAVATPAVGLAVGGVVAAAGVMVAGFVAFDGLDGVGRWWGFPLAAAVGLLVGAGVGGLGPLTTGITSSVGTIASRPMSSGAGAGVTVATVVAIAIALGVAAWAADQSVVVDDAGRYGIGLAAVGMLAITAAVVHVDTSASMAGATARFSVGSAAVTSFALFLAFEGAIDQAGGQLDLSLGQAELAVGVVLGAALSLAFAAHQQSRLLGPIAVVVPLVIGLIDYQVLAGFLAGSLVTGFAVAIVVAGGRDEAESLLNSPLKVMAIVSLVFVTAFV